MAVRRLYPTSDAGPNEWLPLVVTHWNLIDEDVATPNTSDFIRDLGPGNEFEKFNFFSVPPMFMVLGTSMVMRVFHSMTGGSSPTGNMDFPVSLFVDGVMVGFNGITIADNQATPIPGTVGFGGLSIAKGSVPTIQILIDSGDPSQWVSGQYRLYTLNLDLTYTEIEKTIAPVSSNEKVLNPIA